MPVATAPIRTLAWEPPYAAGAAQENGKKTKKKKKKKKRKSYAVRVPGTFSLERNFYSST